MRIVGGEHSGRKLETPTNNDVRPTSDKVRQAVFNMLNSRGLVQGANVIDAFSGTGALGLEAMSQGAGYCTFFDKSRTSLRITQRNIEALGLYDDTYVVCQDVTKCIEKPDHIKVADLVFLDPPYKKNLIPQAIAALKENGWLTYNATFVMEMDKGEDVVSLLIDIIHEKTYGDTKVLLGQFI